MRHLSVLIAATAFGTLPALAHSSITRSSPAADAVLAQPPAEVRLSFSERIEPRFSGIEVVLQGAKVRTERAIVDPAQPKELVLRLPALKPGRYEVKWHAVSSDSHRIEGKFGFEVTP